MAKKILLVEDEPGIAGAFEKQLRLIGGFEVEIARGGKEGLQALEKGGFDVLLLDLVMPEVDGIEVLRLMRDNSDKYAKVPVIVLTNVTSDETKKGVEKFDIQDFIIKTDVTPEVLIEAINKAIGNKEINKAE